ncbi:hypothetical protein Rhopal_007101-T1 [Rhodotorula paludigena]|uniref:Zn(2)-C6 fungal-type domain-containing protein n=1 Tax=Rhodotorula paludigena TaxID=86838 RepID=A0AAV5GUZ2_9BASI|nr:hypothetical protein Rhopal_007101-T1 [Rhodotorula paludigena]
MAPPTLRDGSVASSDNGSGPGNKRKRLPACDCCKMRRLKCEPVPPPGSCPRCKATGVVCTTTPVVRKKALPRSGKRIEEAKATFGTADPDAPDFMGASNTPWVQPRHPGGIDTLATSIREPTFALNDVDDKLAAQEHNGALVAHLLELYQTFPQSWLPIGIRGRILQQFEATGRRLGALPPHTEVLACITIALSARLSSHPALFADGASAIPSYQSLTPAFLETSPDLREFGIRRQAACEKLRRRAVDLAWRRGVLVHTSEETMSCCYLLEMLEGRSDPVAGKPYGSAFVSHLQTILNQQDLPGSTMKIVNMSLGWSALIMREALYAANTGRTSHFTATDDLLLCGEVPISIEETLLESVEDVDVRDSVTLFFRPMRPFTYHTARLARECGEKISGTAARRQPFNENFAAKYLTQLDHLLHLFAILESRIAFVLSPAATAAHSLPAPFEKERFFIMKACLHTLGLAWAALILPVHTELTRRVSDLREPLSPQHGATTAAHRAPERRRTLERLELLLRQVEQTALKAARMVAQCVKEAPSLAFLTFLQQEHLDKWIEVLKGARTVEEGGEGFTQDQKENDLRWILEGLKAMGWSWTDGAPLIASLEDYLGEMPLEQGMHIPGSSSSYGQQSPQEQPAVSLPSPPPMPAFSSPPFEQTPSFAPSAYQSHGPATSVGADVSAFLTTAAPPDPSTCPHPSAAASTSNLSTLSSLFAGATAPSPPAASLSAMSVSTAAPPPSLSHGPPAASPSAPAALPDLSTLISMYSSGALDQVVGSLGAAGMDVGTLASQYFAGTLDVGGLLSNPHIGAAAAAAGLGGSATAQMHSGVEAAVGMQGPALGQTQSEFDLQSLLAEPVFGSSLS